MRKFVIAIATVISSFALTLDGAEASALAYAAADVNCRSAPSLYSPVIVVIPAGASVEVYGRTNGWYEVECAGLPGFVHDGYLAFERRAYAPYYVAPREFVVPRHHRVHPRGFHRPQAIKPPRVTRPRGAVRGPELRRQRPTRRSARPEHQASPPALRSGRAASDRQRVHRDGGRRAGPRSERRGVDHWRGGQRQWSRGSGQGPRGTRRWRGSQTDEAPPNNFASTAVYVEGVHIVTLYEHTTFT